MTADNVIKFPTSRTLEDIEIPDEENEVDESVIFAYQTIDSLHDMLHDETGECIFTDEEYRPMIILISEAISALYLKAHGIDIHPMNDIAENLFKDVDIDDEIGYDEQIIDIDEDE